MPSLLNGIRAAAFAWYSVKIRVIFGVWSERRKADKKGKPTWNLKHANSILESFEYFCQIFIKIDPYNFELYRVKVGAFLETQCISILNVFHPIISSQNTLITTILLAPQNSPVSLEEFAHIDWFINSKLTVNTSETKEIVFNRPQFPNTLLPPLLPDIQRVDFIKLGVYICHILFLLISRSTTDHSISRNISAQFLVSLFSKIMHYQPLPDSFLLLSKADQSERPITKDLWLYSFWNSR